MPIIYVNKCSGNGVSITSRCHSVIGEYIVYTTLAWQNFFERLFPLLGILTSAAMLCITEINKHNKYTGHDELEISVFKPHNFDASIIDSLAAAFDCYSADVT